VDSDHLVQTEYFVLFLLSLDGKVILCFYTVGWTQGGHLARKELSVLSLRFKGHFPGEPGLASVY